MKNVVYIGTLLLVALFSLSARHVNVVVASRNSYKLEAVKMAFGQKFPNDSVECIGYDSVSSVPEQPMGKEAALQGVHNRIQSLTEQGVVAADYVVAIENYIEQYLGSDVWCDRGLILVQEISNNSREIITVSQPTFIADTYIQQVKKQAAVVSDNGYSVTIGQVIQQSFPQRAIDAHDWHREVEFGGVSREKLLQDAVYKTLHAEEIEMLKENLGKHPDFPKPGILFLDFLPILSNARSFQTCIELLAGRYDAKNIDLIVGLESRGFLIGAALAQQLGIGFVPVRKPGKLPGKIYSVEYAKEYGTDILTIAQGSIQPNQRVLVVDDVIATGGSARAAIKLVRLTGGVPIEFVTLLQVPELAQLAKLDIPAFNLID